MTLTNRWMIVVLICGLQLAAAMGLALHATNYFEIQIAKILGNQSTTECSRLGRLLLGNVPDALDADLTLDEQAQRLARGWRAIPDTHRIDLFLVDIPSGQYQPCVDQPTRETLEIGPSTWNSLTSHNTATLQQTLRDEAVTENQGFLRWNKGEAFFSTHRLNSARAIVVAVDSQRVLAEFGTWMNAARNICFSTVLCLGFVTIILTTTILRKFEKQLVRFHEQLHSMVEKRTKELDKTKSGIIFGLAKLAESRDNDTGDHLDRIRHYVLTLAQDLQGTYPEIDEKFLEDIALASSLHDIGKVGIPDAVLLKPGRLTDLERKIMQFHPLIGHECLEAIKSRIGSDEFLKMASEICHYHHERWDGKGYPENIAGDKIPLAARIVAVADVYDALTSRRPYKEPFSHEKSFEIICKEAGTQFDPMVVEAFRRQASRFKSIMESHRECADDNSIVPAIARLQEALGNVELAIPQSVAT